MANIPGRREKMTPESKEVKEERMNRFVEDFSHLIEKHNINEAENCIIMIRLMAFSLLPLPKELRNSSLDVCIEGIRIYFKTYDEICEEGK